MSTQETILIIEDNPFNMEVARFLLQNAQFQVLEAEDANEGIRLAQEHNPNLILMDMHLPTLDGYETCKILKSESKTQDIPIVAFTALAMDEDQKRSLNAGCCGIISKPLDVDNFVDTIRNFLTRSSGNQHQSQAS